MKPISEGTSTRRASMTANGFLRLWLALMVPLALGLNPAAVVPAQAANDVLILAPTVTGGTTSLEATTAAGLGLTGIDVVPAGSWGSPPQAYSAYKVIILGDPSCTATTAGPVAAAEANAATWAAAVKGNVVIIGTDPSYHASGSPGAAQLWKSAIDFARSGPTPGAVIALSCYYDGAAPGTAVNVLNGFGAPGSFKTQGINCSTTPANNVAIVATHPALAGLSEANLSGWSCSVHEGFSTWDPSFLPLAIATDATVPHSFTGTSISGKKVSGFPYILARGATPAGGTGILKVCKVAGLGVSVGTSFTFTAGTSTFTVPAGPGPGGTCVIGPSFAVGTTVTIDEVVPSGHVVSSITVAPSSRGGPVNLAAGTVDVTIGTGVTEVTFTDKRTGFVEICKQGHVTGNFTFTVNPGSLGPFLVPAGACSPAIEVGAGSVVIHELPVPGILMAACATIPASQQLACNPLTQNSTVAVVPGDVSTMTIALITNRHGIPTDGGAAAPGHKHAATGRVVTLACEPNPIPLHQPVTCRAKVIAEDAKTAALAGTVRFSSGDTALGTAQLSPDDGTAVFTTSTLPVGTHGIVATHGGDANLREAASEPVTVRVEGP